MEKSGSFPQSCCCKPNIQNSPGRSLGPQFLWKMRSGEALSERKKSLGIVFVLFSCPCSAGSEIRVCIHELCLHQVGAGVNGPQTLAATLSPGCGGWDTGEKWILMRTGLWTEGVGDQGPSSLSAGFPGSPGPCSHQTFLPGELRQPRNSASGRGRARGGDRMVKLRGWCQGAHLLLPLPSLLLPAQALL